MTMQEERASSLFHLSHLNVNRGLDNNCSGTSEELGQRSCRPTFSRNLPSNKLPLVTDEPISTLECIVGFPTFIKASALESSVCFYTECNGLLLNLSKHSRAREARALERDGPPVPSAGGERPAQRRDQALKSQSPSARLLRAGPAGRSPAPAHCLPTSYKWTPLPGPQWSGLE